MFDGSKALAILDELSTIIPEGTTNDELHNFIRSAFELKNETTPRADGAFYVTFEPLDALFVILPALRAGEISFSAINGILNPEIGIGNEANHDSPPLSLS